LSKSWKKIKKYVATHKWAQLAGSVIAGTTGAWWAPMLWSGFTTYAQGGSFMDIVGSAMMTGVTQGLTSGIGDAYGHNSSFFSIGDATTIAGHTTQITIGMAVKKAIVHGLVRGMVQAGQGGKFESGFASGFVSSGF